jgi:hypothetical protein
MAEDDRRDLKRVVDELQQLLRDVASDTKHPHLLSPARREDLREALDGLANVFGDLSRALENPSIDTAPMAPGGSSLQDAQLTGEPRRRKTAGFWRSVDRFRSWPTRKTLDRVYRWANMLLESLVGAFPPAAVLKELKQFAENLNKDAMEDAAADAATGPA